MYCEPYKLARIVRAAKPWWLQPPWSGSGTLIKPDETTACAPKSKKQTLTERRLLRAVLNRFEVLQFHALPFLLQDALHGCNQF